MTVNQLLNLTHDILNSLTEKELRRYVQQLASAGNKRLKRFSDKNISTFATVAVDRSGGKFSTAEKNLNELRSEYLRIRKFFNSKTSTIKGYRDVIKRGVAALEETGIVINEDDYANIWTIYERIKARHPEIENLGMKYKILEMINEYMSDGVDPEDIIDYISANFNDIYEDQERRSQEFDSIEKLFERL